MSATVDCTPEELLVFNIAAAARIRAQVAARRCKCPTPLGAVDRCDRCCLRITSQTKEKA